MVGGGMANFDEVCCFPTLCRDCERIVTANLLAPTVTCPECKSQNVTPYDDPSLRRGGGSQRVTEWNVADQIGRTLELTDGKYWCPACQSFQFTFEDDGVCWD